MAVMAPMIEVPGSDDVLELEPGADGLGYAASISRRCRDGAVAWTALPPRGGLQDAWTAVRVSGKEVVANSWSCFQVRLDLDAGRQIARQFTK
jgi:hypothetical protein